MANNLIVSGIRNTGENCSSDPNIDVESRVNWSSVAESYDWGRPFPPEHVQKLFEQAPEVHRLLLQGAVVVDIGAGTGRITVPLAKQYPNSTFIAVDNSETLLQVLSRRSHDLSKQPQCIHQDLIASQLLPSGDVYILSSVLHALPVWKNVCRAIAESIRPGGLVALIGEEGDIYNLSLGRAPAQLPPMPASNILSSFWKQYHELRTSVGAPPVEGTQIGCSWEATNAEAVDCFRALGFKESGSASLQWTRTVEASELMRIVDERVFSSLMALSPHQFSQIQNGLRALVSLHKDLSDEARCLATLRLMTKE
jgi:SAM-dependent methyltransferase